MESVWFELNMPNSKNIIIICIVYRPPDGNVGEFCEMHVLANDGNDVSLMGNKDVFIMGDFIINYDQKKSPNMKSLIEFEQLTHFHQLILQPTRGTNITELIFTNCIDVSQAGVHDLLIKI